MVPDIQMLGTRELKLLHKDFVFWSGKYSRGHQSDHHHLTSDYAHPFPQYGIDLTNQGVLEETRNLKASCASPGPPVTIRSANVESPAYSGIQKILESVYWLEVKWGSAASFGGLTPICAAPTCVPASFEPRKLQWDNWKLLPGSLPNGPDARAAIQGIPAKFLGSCYASPLPRGKTLVLLHFFWDRENWRELACILNKAYFLYTHFFGMGNKFSFFSMGCWWWALGELLKGTCC